MRKFVLSGFLLLAGILFLAACSSSKTDEPARAVEAYWQALAAQDSARLSSLTCKDYEAEALNTLESFKSVKTTLNDLVCSTTSSAGSSAAVKCSGTIVASYGSENLTINLADRSYSAVNEGGAWLMCGAK
jgi:hypothetical protein